MSEESSIVAVADLGASKVSVVVARRTSLGLEVCGIGVNESRGLRSGEVVDPAGMAQCLANAIEEAEIMSGETVRTLCVSVNGGHSRGVAASAAVPILGEQVTAEDMDAALAAAVAGRVGPGRTLLHTLVREWVVDGRGGVSRPEGMVAKRLEVRAHLVTAPDANIAQIRHCAKLCDVELESVVLDTLASGQALLDDVEKERGCVLVDIGGGTTDVAIWSDGALVHNTAINRGGSWLTEQVGVAFRVPRAVAERVKRHYGAALRTSVDVEEAFTVPTVEGRPGKRHSRKLLASVLEPSIVELMRHVRREVEISGYEDAVGAGFVLTGGAAALPGMLELSETVFGARVRMGVPTIRTDVCGMFELLRHPKHAVSAGLLSFALESEGAGPVVAAPDRTLAGRIFAKLEDWWRRTF